MFPVCDTITNINNNWWFVITPGVSGNWSFGTKAEFGCDSGYILSHNVTLQCQRNGTSGEWSDVIPQCRPVDCGTNAKVPVNGNITYGHETTFTNEAFVNCSEGYWLNGSQTLNCTSDGTWHPQSQTCNLISKTMFKVQLKMLGRYYCSM